MDHFVYHQVRHINSYNLNLPCLSDVLCSLGKLEKLNLITLTLIRLIPRSIRIDGEIEFVTTSSDFLKTKH